MGRRARLRDRSLRLSDPPVNPAFACQELIVHEGPAKLAVVCPHGSEHGIDFPLGNPPPQGESLRHFGQEESAPI